LIKGELYCYISRLWIYDSTYNYDSICFLGRAIKACKGKVIFFLWNCAHLVWDIIVGRRMLRERLRNLVKHCTMWSLSSKIDLFLSIHQCQQVTAAGWLKNNHGHQWWLVKDKNTLDKEVKRKVCMGDDVNEFIF